MFFDAPFKVRNSLVILPMLVADGLFVDVLLGANWMRVVSAFFDVGQLELVEDFEFFKLKKLLDPSKDFVGSRFKIHATVIVEIAPGSSTMCVVVHCPVFVMSFALWTENKNRGFCLTYLISQTKTELLTPSAFKIILSYL